jgi:hypothetical protein
MNRRSAMQRCLFPQSQTSPIRIIGPKASPFHGPDNVKDGIRNQRGSPVESLDVQRSTEPDTDSDPKGD